MSDYGKLRADLVTALASFEQLISEPVAAASSDLLRERVKLVQAVNGYVSCLRTQLAGEGDAGLPARELNGWNRAYGDLLALRLRYSEHIARWSGCTIERGWRDYCAGSKALIADMRHHLDLVASYPRLAA